MVPQMNWIKAKNYFSNREPTEGTTSRVITTNLIETGALEQVIKSF